MGFFVVANYIEAALWSSIGVTFLLHALSKRGGKQSLIAGMTFLAFALSDVIEARTGAWWRPWWLLALKGTCLAVLVALLARYAATRRTARRKASSRPSR